MVTWASNGWDTNEFRKLDDHSALQRTPLMARSDSSQPEALKSAMGPGNDHPA
jgi:hypothetical protein